MDDSVSRPTAAMTDADSLAELIEGLCREKLETNVEFDDEVGFFEAGLKSMALAGIVVTLKEQGLPVALIDFFTMPTVRLLAEELSSRLAGPAGAED